MKIRAGFVSNSSSSSFILIVGEKTYENVIKSLTPLQKDMASWLVEDVNIDGNLIKIFRGGSGESGWTFDNYTPGDGKTGYKKGSDPEAEDWLDDWWDDVESKFKNTKKCYFNRESF